MKTEMTEPIRKKRPKTNQNSLVKKKPAGPTCPDHFSAMVYVPSELAWLCSEPTCEQIKIPKPEFSSNGVPVPGKGPIELIVYEGEDWPKDQRYLLRATGNNVVLDITALVKDVVVEQSEHGQRIQADLELNSMTIMSGPPNSKKRAR